jgi:hypothetical protein
MSELMNANGQGPSLRETLLATVCGVALFGSIGLPMEAKAEDVDHPTVGIELGGQIERLGNSQEILDPSFLPQFDHLHLDPVLPIQRPARYAMGGEAKITLQPDGTDWVFSASLRYGRSNARKASYQQLPALTFPLKTLFGQKYAPPGVQIPPYHLNASAANQESHVILDFQAGKDVGLGLLSSKGSSTLSLGIRFAQFASRRSANLNGVPDFYQHGSNIFKYGGIKTSNHRYIATAQTTNSFRGVGPSLSWDGSQALLGGRNEGVSVDWGINAAVLFGRQKVRGQTSQTGLHYKSLHAVTEYYASFFYTGLADSYHHHTNIRRSRNVVVPNLGGFAGFSLNFPNAKVSLGYRVDYFFGAMDAGLTIRKTYDRSFYGPFASISVGFGG